MARRSALELAVIDGLLVASAAAALIPGMMRGDVTSWSLLLFCLPGLALAVRALSSATHVRGWHSAAQLDPAFVPSPTPTLRRAAAMTRGAVVLSAVPLVAVGSLTLAARLIP